MPRAIDSTAPDMTGYDRVQPSAQAPAAQQQLAPASTGLERSRTMLASMPGMNAGPDAVQRQFRGGRAAPQGRLFIS